MPYNFAADSFHTKNFVADFLQEKCEFRGKTAVLHYWAPSGDLWETYDNHLRLVGKRVGDFLLVLIELFSLDLTAEALRAIICSNSAISIQRWSVGPKFQVERVAPTNHSFSQETRLNYLSHGVKIWTDFSSVLSQSTHLTDRRTDRQNSHR